MSRAQRIFSETTPNDTITMGTCHSTFGKAHRRHTTKSDPSVNYGLGGTAEGTCRVGHRTKCSTPWGTLIVGESACEGTGEGMWETSVPFTPSCCEPQTALKNKIYFL